MGVARKELRRFLMTVALATSLGSGCDGDRTGPDGVDVTGIWDANFEGTVEGRGTSQTDAFVMDLAQSGSSVTGNLLYEGTDVPLPLSGDVEGNRFAYTATAIFEGCEVRIEATTTVEADGRRLSGAQTQSTCEGTAVGQMTATRR